jgi:hypothetical protein
MERMHGSYGTFVAMVATSTLIMLGLMYLNVYALDHIFWSETRGYMALIMGSTMAVVMLAYMRKMYSNLKANLAISQSARSSSQFRSTSCGARRPFRTSRI